MPQELIMIWGVFFVTTLSCFVIGFSFAGYFHLKMHEKLSLSFGIGFSLIFVLNILVELNYFLGLGAFIGLLAHAIWCFIKKPTNYQLDSDGRALLYVFFAITIVQLTILIFNAYLMNDWAAHGYSYVQSIIDGNFFPDKNRSAAWSFPIAFFLQLYHLPVEAIWVAQIQGVYWNMCFLFPTYSIAMKAFNRKVAWGTVVIMAFSPFFVLDSFGLWGKNFGIYCILVSFYFLFYAENNQISGIFALLAFFVHTSFVFYFGIQVVILLVKRDFLRKKHLPHYIIVIGGVLIYLGLNSVFAQGAGTPFAMLAYPFAVNGPDGLLSGTETLSEVFQDFQNTSFLSVVMWRAISFIFTVAPAWFGLAIYRILVPDLTPPIMTAVESMVYYYRISLFGAIGTIAGLIMIPLILDWLTKRHKIKSEFSLSIILPVLFFVIYIGWKNYGLSSQGNQGAIPFLAMVIVNYLLQKSWSKKLKLIPFVGVFIEWVGILVIGVPYTISYAIYESHTLTTINALATDIGWDILWLLVGAGAIICSYFLFHKKGKLVIPLNDIFIVGQLESKEGSS